MKTLKALATAAVATVALTGCSQVTDAVDTTRDTASSAIATTAPAPASTATGEVQPGQTPVALDDAGFPVPASDAVINDPASARAALNTLLVENQDSSGYNRTQDFGKAWDYTADGVERTGRCDTRDEILARDLTNVTYRTDGCTVDTGILNDPYTGETINFKRGQGTSEKVQIDHVIPLNQAWGSGARQWSQQARQAFANDPGNLLAVEGGANAAKSAKDVAQWLPPKGDYQCQYAVDQVRVKSQWNLSVDKAELDALTQRLDKC